ncbi:hypothetical protein Vafri_18144 [Volvox africanus]|nr:hypothetical protein Vafri_18144 [Volvox africanus]
MKNGSWMPSHDAFLVAGLWMPDRKTGDGGLVSAVLLRVNLPTNSSDSHKKLHVQITFQATVPDLQRHGLGRLLTCCVLKAAAHAKHEYATVVIQSTAPIVTSFWSMVGFRPYMGGSYGSGSNWEHLAAIMDGVMWLSRKQEAHRPIWLAELHQHATGKQQGKGGGGRDLLARGIKGFEEVALAIVQERLSDPSTVPFDASTRSVNPPAFAANRVHELARKNVSSSSDTPLASTTEAADAAGGGNSTGGQPSTLRHARAAVAKKCTRFLFYSEEYLLPAVGTATATVSDTSDTVTVATPTSDEDPPHAAPTPAAPNDEWGLHPTQHYEQSGHVPSATELPLPPLLQSTAALEVAAGSIGFAGAEDFPTAAAEAPFHLRHQLHHQPLLLFDGRRQAFLVQLGCPRASITAGGSISRPEEKLELGLQQRYLRRLRQLQQQGAQETELPPLLMNVLLELRRRRRGLQQQQLMQQDACTIAEHDKY